MRRWKKKILTTAVLFSALTGQVYAEEPAAATDDHTLGETIVTATRTTKRDVDVPAATATITAEEIARSGAATASDVLA